MVVGQAKLANRFENGHESAKASNVELVEAPDGGTMVVGYGHAVYAYRSPKGEIIAFMGWYNRDSIRRHAGSMSTKSQYGTMSIRAKADKVVEGTGTDAAPKATTFNPEDYK